MTCSPLHCLWESCSFRRNGKKYTKQVFNSENLFWRHQVNTEWEPHGDWWSCPIPNLLLGLKRYTHQHNQHWLHCQNTVRTHSPTHTVSRQSLQVGWGLGSFTVSQAHYWVSSVLTPPVNHSQQALLEGGGLCPDAQWHQPTLHLSVRLRLCYNSQAQPRPHNNHHHPTTSSWEAGNYGGKVQVV